MDDHTRKLLHIANTMGWRQGWREGFLIGLALGIAAGLGSWAAWGMMQ